MSYKNSFTKKHSFVLSVSLLALIIRTVYVLLLSQQNLSPDSYDWMAIARSIAAGNGFADTWRPPGYATFLGVVFFLFGESVALVRIINAVLGSLTVVFVYLTGKKIFAESTGRISAVLVCFYPYLIAYTGDLLSETFYTFLIAVSLFVLLNLAEKPDFKNSLITGFLWGITSLTKSTILPFFFFSCFWLVFRTKKIKPAFIAGMMTLLTISPWTFRNYIRYKHFILISPAYQSLAGSNNDTAMILETAGECDQPMTETYVPEEYQKILVLPRMESEKIFKQKAIKWIKDNPKKFRWVLKRRLIHFWRLYPMMAYKWQKIVAMLTSGIYIPLCFIGIILSIKHFKNTSLFIVLFIIYTLVHLPFAIVLRYRVPIDPYIIIFAAYTIHILWIKLRSYISLRV
ncbi:MAG: glycosyltransferase family 39 protein [Elusimicrobiota bacterium]